MVASDEGEEVSSVDSIWTMGRALKLTLYAVQILCWQIELEWDFFVRGPAIRIWRLDRRSVPEAQRQEAPPPSLAISPATFTRPPNSIPYYTVLENLKSTPKNNIVV
jgi:hypothetical protein